MAAAHGRGGGSRHGTADPPPRPWRTLLVLGLLASGCTGFVGEEGVVGERSTSGAGGNGGGEPPAELDPTTSVGGGMLGEPPQGAGGSGGGEEEPPPPPPPPPPNDNEVCYPGQNGDNSACFPLVAWSSSWGSAYAYPSHSSAQYAKPKRYLDLNQVDGGTMLSKNFALNEFMQAHKGRYGLFQVHVVQKLQAIRDSSGAALNINSGYRNVGYNAGVGGATYSRHMYGDAVDMYSGALSLTALSNQCKAKGASYTQLYVSHVHCDWRNSALDKGFYTTGPANAAPDFEAEPDLELDAPEAEIVETDDGLGVEAWGFDEGEPLVEWRAIDVHGEEIEYVVGPHYTPPVGARQLRVRVGGVVDIDATY